MFDPTVYENLKVIVEGAVYDLDLEGPLTVKSRADNVDLASFSRLYEVVFQHEEAPGISAKLSLHADVESFTDEVIHQKEQAGCNLSISFYTGQKHVETCGLIEKKLEKIWSGRPKITQKLSFIYQSENMYQNLIIINFGRRITEDQIDDIPSLLEHTMESLKGISKIIKED